MTEALTIAVTGHRPEKIHNPEWVKEQMITVLSQLQPQLLIQGMAAGVDLLSATVCIELEVPYLAARPWAGHAPRGDDIQLYNTVLQNAHQVVDVDPSLSYRSPAVYQRRNEYMVDHADALLAVWDGTKGGTRNCVVYAEEQGKPIIRINPKKQAVDYPAELEWYFPSDTLF